MVERPEEIGLNADIIENIPTFGV